MLPVEERGAGDPHQRWLVESAPFADLPAAEQRVERRSRERVSRAVLGCRDFHDHAGVDRARGALSQLDVPVAVILHLLHTPHPASEAKTWSSRSARGAQRSRDAMFGAAQPARIAVTDVGWGLRAASEVSVFCDQR